MTIGRTVECVGESHYLDAFTAIVGDAQLPINTLATLQPEPTNPYDAQAVAVVIDGHKCWLEVGEQLCASLLMLPAVAALGGGAAGSVGGTGAGRALALAHEGRTSGGWANLHALGSVGL